MKHDTAVGSGKYNLPERDSEGEISKLTRSIETALEIVEDKAGTLAARLDGVLRASGPCKSNEQDDQGVGTSYGTRLSVILSRLRVLGAGLDDVNNRLEV